MVQSALEQEDATKEHGERFGPFELVDGVNGKHLIVDTDVANELSLQGKCKVDGNRIISSTAIKEWALLTRFIESETVPNDIADNVLQRFLQDATKLGFKRLERALETIRILPVRPPAPSQSFIHNYDDDDNRTMPL